MWRYRYTSELYHYGIKGMKWGVRRTKRQLQYDRYSIMAVLNKNLHKIKTPNGVKVKTVSSHALDRIEKYEDRKVTAKEIGDALVNPIHIDKIKVDKQGRRSIRYIGEKATVNVNPDIGKIATVWQTGRRQIRKYKGV